MTTSSIEGPILNLITDDEEEENSKKEYIFKGEVPEEPLKEEKLEIKLLILQ